MINLKEFFEHGMFDILGTFHGSYEDIVRWMKKTGCGRHEVTSAKLDFIMDTMEINIR